MPTSLQGLNIVYPPLPPSDNPSQDILTPPPGFPDLSAQLDLWTNLSFASDEPFIDKDRIGRDHALDQKLRGGNESEDMHGNVNHNHGHIVNADKPIQTTTDNDILIIQPTHRDGAADPHINGAPGSFDLGTFLAGFGIDPFLVPPQALQSDLSSLEPSTNSSVSSSSSPSDIAPRILVDADQPPTKRTRTRKGSTASQAPAIAPSALQQPAISRDTRAVSEFSEDHDPLSTPLTATEDKRRRNTAASARFRAKKKEREQALEKRSKELEIKVTELERECEGLRRENGWLKGLVVGVTGGNPSGVPQVSADGNSILHASGNESTGGKRKRDVETTSGKLEGR